MQINLKIGFSIINRDDLPQKIWRECINCPKFPDCDEIAVIKNIEFMKKYKKNYF